MDSVLSECINKTSTEPGLARDILESHNWCLQVALCKFYIMKNLVYNKDENILINDLDKKNNVIFKSLSHSLINLLPENQLTHKENVDLQTNSFRDESHKVIFESIFHKKLFRGISRATDNINLVSKIRNEFSQDFQSNIYNECLKDKFNSDVSNYTFTLPDMSIHSEDFKKFLEKDLIEKSTLISLMKAKRLNWWSDDLKISQKLWPLATTGDGNCLLHAASLGMWGFHDRLLTLRKALHFYLINNSSTVSSFYLRWRWQCSLQNKESGLILCEEEWTNEWQSLLKMASIEPRIRGYYGKKKNTELNGGKKEINFEDEFQNHVYESLEEIHIFALAHILKRPIIVIADTMLKDVTGEPFAPIPFGGIYLPLQCDPKECNRSPLCLTYDAAHFSALVAMDRESFADKTPLPPVAIPLVDSNEELLPLQFVVEPSPNIEWNKNENDKKNFNQLTLTLREKLNLLNLYLDIVFLNKDPNQPFQKVNLTLDKFICENSFNKSNFSSELNQNNLENFNEKPIITCIKDKKNQKFLINNISNKISTFKRILNKRIKKKIETLKDKSLSKKVNKSQIKEIQSCANYKEVNLLNECNSNKNLIPKDFILAALIHTDNRPDYYDLMMRNYFHTARLRFLKDLKEKQNFINENTKTKQMNDFVAECVNTGCLNFGKSSTNYLCKSCFINQQKEFDFIEKKKLLS